MGCSKNLVDSEALTRLLLKKGYRCNFDPKRPQGEYVVVNTCGFIEDAKQESIDTILELIEQKNSGKIGYLYVMGCLSQRYLNQLEEENELSPEKLANDLFDNNLTARLSFVDQVKESIPDPVRFDEIDASRQLKKFENQKLSLSNGIELLVPNHVYEGAIGL